MKKQDLTAAEKVKIIRNYMSGTVGRTESVKKAKCSEYVFQHWVRKY